MRAFRRRVVLAAQLLLFALPAAAEPSEPCGNWVTLQDGKPVAVVKLEERGGRLFGTVVRFVDPRLRDPRCSQCEGHRRDKPILGMQVIWNLERDGDEWSGGHVLDPTTGKVYACQLELVNGGSNLEVRAYVGVSWVGRTLVWRRSLD